jgi:hypothetical protein
VDFLMGMLFVMIVMFAIRVWAYHQSSKQVESIQPHEEWDEERIDIIGQNGPTGDHYDEVENSKKEK